MNRLTWLSEWSADVVRDLLSDAALGRLNWVRGLYSPVVGHTVARPATSGWWSTKEPAEPWFGGIPA